MREETKQRLEREIRRRRIMLGAAIAGGVAVFLAVAVALTWFRQGDAASDPVASEREVAGTVERWQNAPRRSGLPILITLDVVLDDGRRVHASSSVHASASIGGKVRLIERTHRSGRVDHLWP